MEPIDNRKQATETLNKIQEARAAVAKMTAGGLEKALVITKLDEARLWTEEMIRSLDVAE